MVSIVLPTFNGSKYLSQSIESIIGQTFNDWELIIVDDCSTDNTWEIACTYAKLDSRIRVLHNEKNMKLPKSLNIGFREAKGDLFTWTSDDNYYYENAVELMKKELDTSPRCIMVRASMDLVDSKGELIGRGIDYSSDRMLYNNCMGACFLYRRRVLDDLGGYDEDLFGVEDYEYWLRVIFKYGDPAVLDDVLYAYRVHDKSLTATKRDLIRERLNLIRAREFYRIVSRLNGNDRYLSALYYDLMMTDALDSHMENIILDRVEDLALFKNELLPDKDYIVYGAGEYGDMAFEMIQELEGGRIVHYSDGDINKIGTLKNGVSIINKEEMFLLSQDCQIIIALDSSIILDVLREFYYRGVRKMVTLQDVIRMKLHYEQK